MNLEWKEMEPSPMTWYQAKEIESESYRLPTLKELRDAYRNKVVGFQNSFLWTNDDKEDNWERAWYYGFGNDQSGTLNKNMHFYVRLCREIK